MMNISSENPYIYPNGSELFKINRERRHMSFVNSFKVPNCYRSDYMAADTDACMFVTDTQACVGLVNYINYLQILVCYFGMDQNVQGYFLMAAAIIIIIGVYGMQLFIIGRYFVIPNLALLLDTSNKFGFTMGLTYVSVLRSSFDLINKILGCNIITENGSYMLTEGMGKIMGLYTVGMIILSSKAYFRTNFLTFAPVTGFLLFGQIGLFYIVKFKWSYENVVHEAYELRIPANIMCISYVIYCACQFTFARKRKLDDTKLQSDLEDEEEEETDLSVWQLTLYALNPFEHLENWSKFGKIFAAPFWIIPAFIVPVVENTRPIRGWCKPITCLCFLLYPWLFNLHAFGFFPMLAGWLIAMYISLFVFAFSEVNVAPRHPRLIAIFGVYAGFMLYDKIDSEIKVSLWQLLNYMFGWNGNDIVLLAFPMGYIISEIVMSTSFIDRGMPGMAFGLTSGVPIFWTYMVLFSISYQNCVNKPEKTAVFTANTETAAIFIILILTTFTFCAVLSNYQFRPCHGLILLVLCCVYYLFVLLAKEEVIHGYGSVQMGHLFVRSHHSTFA